jgi:two-component system phosphate regulon response regulator PhoB
MALLGTVLLVDDEPFILEATARLLRGAGFEVHPCQQWAGVATVVRDATPDLILLDYHMPSLNGDNVCIILKRTLADTGVRIVLYSSEAAADLAEIVERCGADGYICKNDASTELVRRVGDEVERARRSRQSLAV